MTQQPWPTIFNQNVIIERHEQQQEVRLTKVCKALDYTEHDIMFILLCLHPLNDKKYFHISIILYFFEILKNFLQIRFQILQ